MIPAWPPRLLALRLLLALLVSAATLRACRISEIACRNGRCVQLDRYCDGVDDCGDNTDEPRFCTVCNRTYYGDVGKTYELELHKPREDRLPFLCHLTFTANGHIHGDLVQLIFDAFHVGRYEATALDGCPDGSMQLAELGRPFTGGSWCGASSAPGGYAVYYSETSTVTLSIRLYPGPSSLATPFEFRLRYKFVSHETAVVRFGPPGAPLERGQPVPGTYCSRNYDECYRRRCRLQSPNYPGMYPRNVTCYLSVRQKNTPACKHAMIAVRQESTHKMHIKRRSADNNTQAAPASKSGALRAWSDCTGERDHLIFYDGASTDDPVLVKFCGGDWLPPVVTRGPQLLVAFHSSPFSAPLHAAPTAPSPLKGFELDVEVIFVDSESFDFARDSHKCEFWLNASKSALPDEDTDSENVVITGGDSETNEIRRDPTLRSGILSSPRHTLSPNTTCIYHFVGRAGDRIWIAFESYWHQTLLPPPGERPLPPPPGSSSKILKTPPPTTKPPMTKTKLGSCATWLKIWEPLTARSIAEHCDSSPRLCDHAMLANTSRITRPCAPHESYLSSGSSLELEHKSLPGTALHPAAFRLRYEFVDTRLAGELWKGSIPPGDHSTRCTRLLRHPPMKFSSPKNVFLFGRGGNANLSCVYRLEAPAGRVVRITLRRASFGEDSMSRCATRPDLHTGRPRCVNIQSEPDGRWSELRLIEVPWRDVRTTPSCVCDNSSVGLEYESASRVLELHFIVQGMNASEDYADFHFEASFDSLPAGASDCARKRRLRGSGGEINFNGPPTPPTLPPGLEEITRPPPRRSPGCAHLPWLLEATENHSLFVLTWGSLLPLESVLPAQSISSSSGLPVAAASTSDTEVTKCPTQNRILLYTGRPARLARVVCPATPHSPQHALHLFSVEWWGAESVGVSSVPTPIIAGTGNNDHLEPSRPPRFLIEFIGREPGKYAIHWLEVSRSKASTSALLSPPSGPYDPVTGPFFYYATENQTDSMAHDCPYRCPELDACISGSLWCDGKANCPSGYDESEENCEAFSLSAVYVYLGGGIAAIIVALISCIICAIMAASKRRKYGKHRHYKKEEEEYMGTMGRRGRAPTEELLIDPS